MKYSIILFASLFLLGCKGDPGPAGPTLSGDISGRVYLFAENGQLLTDKSNAHVSIDDSPSFVLTSSDGSWTLPGVPAGIHTIVSSKTGFFTHKNFNIQFVGGGTYYWGTIYLSQIPSTSIKQLIVSRPPSSNVVHFQGTLSLADSVYTFAEIIFDTTPIGTSPTVVYLFSEVASIPPDSTSFSFDAQFGEYIKTEYGLTTGSPLYARAYLMSNGGYYDNYNPATQKYEIYDKDITFSNLQTITFP